MSTTNAPRPPLHLRSLRSRLRARKAAGQGRDGAGQGVEPNQVTVANFHEPKLGMEDKPEIAAVFKIALENLILTLASELGCSIQGDIDSQVMLKAKGQRIGLADAQLEGFLQISDLHGLPDIGALFTAGQLSFDALMEIREHQTTKGIRKWVREADPLTSEDIVRAYVSSLREKSPVNSLPVNLAVHLHHSVRSHPGSRPHAWGNRRIC